MGQLHLQTCPLQSSLRQENVTVFGCLTHEVPLSLGDAAVTCSKGEDEEWGKERRLVGRAGDAAEVGIGLVEGGARATGKRGQAGEDSSGPDPTLTPPLSH